MENPSASGNSSFIAKLTCSTTPAPPTFFVKHITITRKDDGTYRLNFKPLKMDADYSVDVFAIEVCEDIIIEVKMRGRRVWVCVKNGVLV